MKSKKTEEEYKIRKATMKDFDELFKFRILSKKEELKYSDTLKPISQTKKLFKEYLELDLTKPDRILFVAEKDGKIVGSILAKFFIPLRISKYKTKGYMSNLFIDKKHRRKGLALKMMQVGLKWLKDNKVKYISGEIHKDNIASQKLLDKLGFTNYTVKMIKKL